MNKILFFLLSCIVIQSSINAMQSMYSVVCFDDSFAAKKIQTFIDKHVNVNVQDKNGFTPLHLASQKGFIKTVTILIEAQANVYLKDKYGYTALDYAVRNGHHEVMQLISAHMARKETQALLGATHARIGANCSMPSLPVDYYINIFELLKQKPVTRSVKPMYSDKFQWAATQGDIETVKSLLLAGVDVNQHDLIGGWTPLNCASQWGRLSVVQTLIAAGSDVKISDHCGRTPLMFAAIKGYQDIAQFIKDHIASQEMCMFLCAQHLRTGAQSPAHALPPQIYQDIFELLRKADR
jgi:ankyrin repeat protein